MSFSFKDLKPLHVISILLGGLVGLLIGIPAGVAAGANFGFLVILIFTALGVLVGYRQRDNRLFLYFSLFTFLVLVSTLFKAGV